jgi:hypothetical protein
MGYERDCTVGDREGLRLEMLCLYEMDMVKMIRISRFMEIIFIGCIKDRTESYTRD